MLSSLPTAPDNRLQSHWSHFNGLGFPNGIPLPDHPFSLLRGDFLAFSKHHGSILLTRKYVHMSTDSIFHAGYGYIFNPDDNGFSQFVDNLKTAFPELAVWATVEGHFEQGEFLLNSFDEFNERYPGLRIELVDDMDFQPHEVLVMLASSISPLDNDYQGEDVGAVYTDGSDVEDSKLFDSFKKDFNLTAAPQNIIWRELR